LRLPRVDRLPGLAGLLNNRTVRLAVTGLSGSGKTAFVTSLVHNLLSAIGQPARLPFLHATAERRIFAARLGASESETIAQFPVYDVIAALAADPPRWPASTTDLRRADLSLRFTPGSILGRAAGGAAELRLEILDYPGEWLLDLPLLGQTYREWSRATLERARCGARAPLARDWLDFVGRHPADSPGDPETVQRAHGLYRAFLAACRTKERLSLL
jgi:uncharacterized protein